MIARALGAGPTDRKPSASASVSPARNRVTSGPGPAGFPSLFQSRPHSRGVEFCAWECKVTPAGCACQEGNTIGCIPSNDGLGAGLAAQFPQEKQVSKFQGFKVSKFVP